MVKLGYQNLPTLAMWRIDSYVSLTSDQRDFASRRIEALHQWHRSTQLGDYADLLRTIQQRVAAGPVDAAQIGAWRRQMVERWRPVADRLAPDLAQLAVTLQPAQLQRMRGEIDGDNRKFQRDRVALRPNARLDARVKRYADRIDFFMGDVTDAQRQLVRRMAAALPAGIEEQWLTQRVARQHDLMAVLERIGRERPPQAEAQRWVRAHLMRYFKAHDPADEAEYERAMAAGDQIWAAALAQATPAQRTYLHRKLQDLIDAAAEVGGRPAATAALMLLVDPAG